jgi:hypothetical protein
MSDSRWNELRWRMADWLSFLACKLRGDKWYLGSSWHAVPGNRAADLSQRIWEDVTLISVPFDEDDDDARDRIEKHLMELSQKAGECWGHIQTEQRTPCKP